MSERIVIIIIIIIIIIKETEDLEALRTNSISTESISRKCHHLAECVEKEKSRWHM